MFPSPQFYDGLAYVREECLFLILLVVVGVCYDWNMESQFASADLRRARVLDIITKDPHKSVKQAMLEVGYSETYAQNSHMLFQAASFQERLKEISTDASIIASLRALLNRRAYHKQQFDMDTPDEEILDHIEKIGAEFPKIKVISVIDRKREVGARGRFKWVEYPKEVKEVGFYVPDDEGVNRALDKIFKLRGDYAPEKENGPLTIGKLFVNIFNDKNSRFQRSTTEAIDPEAVALAEPVQDQEQASPDNTVQTQ